MKRNTSESGSESTSSEEEETEKKWEEWIDDSIVETKGLFSDKMFKSPEACWLNCIEEFGWNHDKIYEDWKMDELQHIQLINYIRTQIATTPAAQLIGTLNYY